MHLSSLIDLGFVESGVWSLEPKLKGGVRFKLHHHQADRVIYAFVLDDDVKYIGVCDSMKTCFSDRMRRYQARQGQGTNERVVGYIKAALSGSGTLPAVRIFAWRPQVQLSVGGIPVDLIMGLEKPLIERIKPQWNRAL